MKFFHQGSGNPVTVCGILKSFDRELRIGGMVNGIGGTEDDGAIWLSAFEG